MKKIYYILMVLLVACNSNKTPETTLKEFVNYRFKSGQSRSDILKMVTGTVEERISNMTDEEFEKFTEVESLQRKKFKVNIKNCEAEKCFLTYTVGYSDNLTDSSYAVEARKIATLLKEGKVWKIADVNNVKTAIDTKDAIEAPVEKK
ncbi:hypothetical protein OAT67_06450 [Bacteriovoracaceae bacterium]|nr:hypothetical protein [Bacteriovoracaceae bacterium]|tara:strand:- start:48873 stop:49316 length:444 start_codon:yes stop_codon:yes gene_type:complete